METDGEWASESAAAFGWGVGHSQVAVLDRTLARAEKGEESWAIGVLKHATFADAAAGADLLERLLHSPDTVEDLVFLRAMEPPLEQSFPDFPQYWGPAAELDAPGTIADAVIDRILSILGEAVPPDRLRQFDESFAFDLERAAEDDGSADADT